MQMLRLPKRQRCPIEASSCALLLLAVVFWSGRAAAVEASSDTGLSAFVATTDLVAGYYRLGRDYELGRGVEKDLFEAARQYELAARQGHVEAQYSLALLFVGAVPDSPRSLQKSFRWFGEAARSGHERAAYFLAMSFQNGVGTDRNSEKAFEWYRRSAMSGNGEAMNALARMYAAGAGIRLNLANAYAWNEVAGAQGYDLAQRFKAGLVADMSEEEIARGETLVGGLMKKYGGSQGIDPAGPSARLRLGSGD